MINIKTDEALIRQQIVLSKKLFEMDPEIAKKVIEAANLEIERLEKLQKEADEKSANACKMIEAGKFYEAFNEFKKEKGIRDKVGDIIGAKIAEALSIESMIRSLMNSQQIYHRSNFHLSSFWEERALVLYGEIEDIEGIDRVNALMNAFKQLEEGDNERFLTAEFLKNETIKDLEFIQQFSLGECSGRYGQKPKEIFVLLVYIRSVNEKGWYSVFLEERTKLKQ